MPGGSRGQLSDGRPSQKHAPTCKIREGRQGGKNEPTRNAKRAATTVLPTTGDESGLSRGAEAIRRRVADATAMTFVPTTGARTRRKKVEVAPPRPHAEDAEEEAASDVCVEILAGVVARWTANLSKDAELQAKRFVF